jgi:hypothetical protein
VKKKVIGGEVGNRKSVMAQLSAVTSAASVSGSRSGDIYGENVASEMAETSRLMKEMKILMAAAGAVSISGQWRGGVIWLANGIS